VQALRDAAVESTTRSTRRVVAGTITTVAGIGLIAQGLSGAGAGPVALGALCVFLGVAWLGPVIASRFVRIAGWPLSRMHGVNGRLARENAMRNPRRTAATSSALMVGIGLVAFMTVFAASARASIATSVDRAMQTDFIITTQYGMGGLSPTVAERIDSLPETGIVTSLRYFDTKVRGAITSASAVDPARVADGVKLHVRSGDFARLGTDGVAVQADTAKHDHVQLGDTVTMTFPETGDHQFTVVAIYGTKEPLGDYVISTQAFDRNTATHVDNDVVVSAAPGVSTGKTRAAVERVLRDFPTAELLTKSEFTGSMTREITKTLNLVYVLLAMALLIALFGIANTLALSVFERRRELGVLRALGMTRAQMRSSVRWESVLIALLGTSLGTLIGFGFGWSLVRALEKQGFNTFAVPYLQLAAIVGCTAMAAVVAALQPARRAAKVDILTAINAV
jgi:putative ABC transport system permease protein